MVWALGGGVVRGRRFPGKINFTPFLHSFVDGSSVSVSRLTITVAVSGCTVAHLTRNGDCPASIYCTRFYVVFAIMLNGSFSTCGGVAEGSGSSLITGVVTDKKSTYAITKVVDLVSTSNIITKLSTTKVASKLTTVNNVVKNNVLTKVTIITTTPLMMKTVLCSLYGPGSGGTSFLLTCECSLSPGCRVGPRSGRSRSVS